MSHSSLDKSLHICREPPFRNTCKAVKIFRRYSERYWGLRFRDTEKSNSRNSAVSYVQSFLVFSLTILLLSSPNGTDVRHTHTHTPDFTLGSRCLPGLACSSLIPEGSGVSLPGHGVPGQTVWILSEADLSWNSGPTHSWAYVDLGVYLILLPHV